MKGNLQHYATTKKLPLRLVPRRTRVMIRLLFVLAWCGMAFSALIPALAATLRHDLPWERAPSSELGLFAIIFLAVGVIFLARALVAALPNSPFRYLEIDEQGLKRRHYNNVQRAAWKDIEWISVVERWQSHGKGRSRHWWVVAENATSPFEQDASRRIKDAVLAYNANDFKPLFGGGEETAAQLVHVLREGLTKARDGEPITALELPPLLQNLAVEMQAPEPAAGEARKGNGSKKRRGVIER